MVLPGIENNFQCHIVTLDSGMFFGKGHLMATVYLRLNPRDFSSCVLKDPIFRFGLKRLNLKIKKNYGQNPDH